LSKTCPEGAKFRNTLSACCGDRNFEGFAIYECQTGAILFNDCGDKNPRLPYVNGKATDSRVARRWRGANNQYGV